VKNNPAQTNMREIKKKWFAEALDGLKEKNANVMRLRTEPMISEFIQSLLSPNFSPTILFL
jgi:hypothetical protein